MCPHLPAKSFGGHTANNLGLGKNCSNQVLCSLRIKNSPPQTLAVAVKSSFSCTSAARIAILYAIDAA